MRFPGYSQCVLVLGFSGQSFRRKPESRGLSGYGLLQCERMDSGFRRNDGVPEGSAFNAKHTAAFFNGPAAGYTGWQVFRFFV